MVAFSKCITLTFGDFAENHPGMQKLAASGENHVGFSLEDLKRFQAEYAAEGLVTELINLHEGKPGTPPAYVLVVRRVAQHYLGEEGAEKLYDEQDSLTWNNQIWNDRKKKVQFKHARLNLCYHDTAQEACYEEKKGTVIAWRDIPLSSQIHNILKGAKDLVAEGNKYLDVTKNGIGYHGDTERHKALGLRLGATMVLVFQWFYDFGPAYEGIRIMLNHGDVYYMCAKAVGTDWKKNNNNYVLRHAAGAAKYLSLVTHHKKYAIRVQNKAVRAAVKKVKDDLIAAEKKEKAAFRKLRMALKKLVKLVKARRMRREKVLKKKAAAAAKVVKTRRAPAKYMKK